MRISPGLCLAVCCFVASHAAIIRYEATGTFVRSDFPGDVVVGDRFSVTFAYDATVSPT
jgi:hypothetical protein